MLTVPPGPLKRRLLSPCHLRYRVTWHLSCVFIYFQTRTSLCSLAFNSKSSKVYQHSQLKSTLCTSTETTLGSCSIQKALETRAGQSVLHRQHAISLHCQRRVASEVSSGGFSRGTHSSWSYVFPIVLFYSVFEADGFLTYRVTPGRQLHHVPDKGHSLCSTDSLGSHHLLVIFFFQGKKNQGMWLRDVSELGKHIFSEAISVCPSQVDRWLSIPELPSLSVSQEEGCLCQNGISTLWNPSRTESVANCDIIRKWPLSYTK